MFVRSFFVQGICQVILLSREVFVVSNSRFYGRKRCITVLVLALALIVPSFSQADEAGVKELRKIVEALISLDRFEANCNLGVMGQGLKDKPNVPRSGKLKIATNGTDSRKIHLSIPYGGQTFDACLAMENEVIYFYLNGKKELAYFFDLKDENSAKNNPMISGIAGSAKGLSVDGKRKKIDEAMKKLHDKGAQVTVISPGQILVTHPQKKEIELKIGYDLKTYLPKVINVFKPEQGIHLNGVFEPWITSGAVDTKLPVPPGKFTPFAMDKVGQIMAAAPKPQELLSHKPVVPVNSAKPLGFQNVRPTAHLAHQSSQAHVPAGMVAVPKAEYHEMKQTISELKSTLKVLQDPSFQKSLREASDRIEKLEAQLKQFER